MVLSDPMETLLNRGLNFSILPLKLDFTQVLVDYRRFERAAIWKEFWYGIEDGQPKKETIFKVKKNNMPKNYSSPEGLKTFLNSVKSKLSDPQNRNEIESNLPAEELAALKDLINLQKTRQIIIKACDKGAGIIILDFEDYLKACYDHLTSEVSPGTPYYSPVTPLDLERSKILIKYVLEEALTSETITKSEYEERNPDNKVAG